MLLTRMAPTVIDLGRLDLVSTTSDLQVQVQSSAQFALSAEDAGEIESKLTTGAPYMSLGSRPWIYSTHNYRFVLGIKIEDEPTACSQHKITDAVAAAIGEAPVCGSQGLL